MPEIKTKDSNPLKRLPAAIPRTVIQTKNIAVKAKERAEETQQARQRTPSEYAEGKVTSTAEKSARQVRLQVSRFAKKLLKRRKELLRERQDETAGNCNSDSRDNRDFSDSETSTRSGSSAQRKQNKLTTKKKAGSASPKDAEPAFSMSKTNDGKRGSETAQKNALNQETTGSPSFSPRVRYPEKKTIKQPEHTVKRTIKLHASDSIKMTNQAVKSTEKMNRAAIKTSEQMMKKTAKSAKAAAKASKRSAQASRKAAKESAKGIKRIAKAMKSTAQAIIKAIKWLVLAIAAGGWIAVLAFVIIAAVALLVSSVFGIFFSGEAAKDGDLTISAVIREINTEYLDKLDAIKAGNPHDELVMAGDRAPWKEVIAVYAVKTNTDPDNPAEIVTMDEKKKENLKAVFWDMNSLSHSVAEREVTETITETDDKGKETTKQVTNKKKMLTITVNAKTALEMASEYRFSQKQLDLLSELLSPEYDSLWNAVLYGISSGSNDIVEVAASQLGNVGGQPYWSWYGFLSREEWCACFVSWCANECGYIEAGIIPKFASCSVGITWFQSRGQWRERGYEPMPGDLIFIDWYLDGDADHVAIVEKYENGVVYTIEGNSSDVCRRDSYSLNSSVILGYAAPAYE